MTFIPAPNAIRLCLQAVWAGQTVEFCIGILKNTAVVAADLATVTGDLESWRVTQLRPQISADITWTQWYALSLATLTSPSLITPITANVGGGAGQPAVPNNVALVTTFQTDLRGRSYRGRVYTYGVPADQMVTTTEVDPTYAAGMDVVYGQIQGALTAGFVHCVISYQNNNVVRSTAARTPVTAYRTEVRLDSQRRRLEGRGS